MNKYTVVLLRPGYMCECDAVYGENTYTAYVEAEHETR